MEDAGAGTVLYAYELDPATKSYGPVGIFHDRASLKLPFEVEIDLIRVCRR